MLIRRQEGPPPEFKEVPIPGDTVTSFLNLTGAVLLLGVVFAGVDLLSRVGAGVGVGSSLIAVVALWVCAWLLFAVATGLNLLAMIIGNLRLMRQSSTAQQSSPD